MLVTTLTFTIGFMLSIVWAIKGQIDFGPFCTLQAVLKQYGNVATALWVLVIAVHTFSVVFLEMKVPNAVFYIVFCAVWLLSGGIVAVGPLFYTTERLGPWYGISAQWCWTSDTYATPRFATEYLWVRPPSFIQFPRDFLTWACRIRCSWRQESPLFSILSSFSNFVAMWGQTSDSPSKPVQLALPRQELEIKCCGTQYVLHTPLWSRQVLTDCSLGGLRCARLPYCRMPHL